MSRFFRGLWVVAEIELRQRVRGVAWYVLLGIFALLLLIVSVLLTIVTGLSSGLGSSNAGPGLYSFIIYFVLLLGSLVAPALGGNTINGDRDSGTLATTQITLITTPQLVLGKFVAAWLSALAFLVVALPFLLYSQLFGGTPVATIVISLLILAAELGVISAVGVGLSGILRRPLFSIVVTYLVVATLSVGTLIGFGLVGSVIQTPTTTSSNASLKNCDNGYYAPRTVPRFDEVWWMLAANPYVILADAAPTQYGADDGYPTDLFGSIKLGVRSAQIPPSLVNSCDDSDAQPTAREIIDSTVPSWAVGLAIQLALAVAALWFAIALTHAPSRRLAAGSRVA